MPLTRSTRTAPLTLALIGLAGHLTAAQAPRSRPSRPNTEEALAKAEVETYKTVGDTRLKLYIFTPDGHRPDRPRPAVVFFFGGGWLRGSPGQFAPHCERLARQGMVAITADYRVYNRQRAKVMDCVADAQSAIRWVRANAKRLGIDPDRIAAGGGSAGGHLAAATATLRDFTEGENKSISFRPNALLLFNPPLDLRMMRPRAGNASERSPEIRARLGTKADELSPAAHIKPALPPTIIFHGKADALIPYSSMESFTRQMKSAGNRCELHGFEGQGHGFFNPGKSGGKYFDETLKLAEEFLASLGYLKTTTSAPAAARTGGR